MKQKIKIMWTNICRIFISIMFIDVSKMFSNKAYATITCYDAGPVEPIDPTCYGVAKPLEITCYAAGPEEKITFFEKYKVFILLVPIVILVLGVIILIKRRKNKKVNVNIEDNNIESEDKNDIQ